MRNVIAKSAAILAIGVFHLSISEAQVPCSLIAQQASLTAQGTPTSSEAIVQSGVTEFNGLPNDGRFSINVEASTITMLDTTGVNQNIQFNSGAAPYTVTFNNGPIAIIGITVAVNGVISFTSANVSFTAKTVKFSPANSIWKGGDSVMVTLQTASCPMIADVDADGQVSALTDGLLMLRYVLGLRGSALTTGAIGANARRNGSQIETYIGSLMP